MVLEKTDEHIFLVQGGIVTCILLRCEAEIVCHPKVFSSSPSMEPFHAKLVAAATGSTLTALTSEHSLFKGLLAYERVLQ